MEEAASTSTKPLDKVSDSQNHWDVLRSPAHTQDFSGSMPVKLLGPHIRPKEPRHERTVTGPGLYYDAPLDRPLAEGGSFSTEGQSVARSRSFRKSRNTKGHSVYTVFFLCFFEFSEKDANCELL